MRFTVGDEAAEIALRADVHTLTTRLTGSGFKQGRPFPLTGRAAGAAIIPPHSQVAARWRGSGGCVLAVVWQFDVQPGQEEGFERLHGADGDWTFISRRSRSFLGSSFLKDLTNPGRYLLVEYWSEMFVYEKHLADFSDDVEELKARRSGMLVESIALGLFDALDVPERFGPTWSVRDGR